MAEKIKKSLSWITFFTIAILIVGSGLYPFFFSSVKSATTSTVTSQVAVGNAIPVVSSVELDLPSSLVENSSVTATCTATITDTNGGATVSYATATMYYSNVADGPSCNDDNNDCYTQIACSLGNPSGNTIYATCTEAIWFYAIPTDGGATTWNCDVIAEDNQTDTATSTDATPAEIATLNAVEITSSVAYGTLSVGATSSASQTTIATTTGNAALDLLSSSTDFILAGGVATIAGDKQVYSLSDVAYESMTTCATTSYSSIEAVLAKPTASPSNSTDTIYWKMSIPAGAGVGTYNSTSSIVATAD